MRIFSLRPCWSKATSVSVGASVEVSEKFIEVDFSVREPHGCFCVSKEQDGEAVWQDSCVEVFLNMLGDGVSVGSLYAKNEYVYLEFNSKGVCYAARGKSREDRKEFSKDEYSKIIRTASGITKDGDFYRWNLSVQIPDILIGISGKNLRNIEIEGNLYKCADLAAEPHYLSAFPIKTEKPDFHRPESFQNMNMLNRSRFE
jgi:hypothetical protein